MEIRMQEILLVGRMTEDPIVRPDGIYFRFQADENEKPFPCFCEGKVAENLIKFCQGGDEFSIEGKLFWKRFKNTGDTLLIKVKYTSYGRKLRTLR